MSEFEFVDAFSPTESAEAEDQGNGIGGRAFPPHLKVPGAIGMAPYLRGLKEYQDARTVLIVDDGVASVLMPTVRGDQKVCYLMDPLDGSVSQFQYPSYGRYAVQGHRVPIAFANVMPIWLVLTGCHGMAGGLLFTSGIWVSKAFNELRRLGIVGDHSCVVTMVNQYQHDCAAPHNLCFARARYAIVDGLGTQNLGAP